MPDANRIEWLVKLDLALDRCGAWLVPILFYLVASFWGALSFAEDSSEIQFDHATHPGMSAAAVDIVLRTNFQLRHSVQLNVMAIELIVGIAGLVVFLSLRYFLVLRLQSSRQFSRD